MARAIWKGAIAFRPGQHPRRAATPPCAITGRSSGCSTPRTSRPCNTSASAGAKASPSHGRTWSRATSTRKGSTSSSRRTTSRLPLSRRRHDRHPRLRRSRRDRRALLRDAVLPAAGKGAERSYALLREAMRESGKIGVAKMILREAQHLAALEAIGDALVLTMMRFRTSSRTSRTSASRGKADMRPAELKMARQLIDNLVRDMGSGEVHRRIQRQPDAGDQRQDEGQEAEAHRARTTAETGGSR